MYMLEFPTTDSLLGYVASLSPLGLGLSVSQILKLPSVISLSHHHMHQQQLYFHPKRFHDISSGDCSAND